MRKFCVAYDLMGDDDRNRNHKTIEDVLLFLDGKRIQKSVWLIISDDFSDCKSLKEELLPLFKKKDRLFISLIDKSDKYVLINSY